MTVSTGPEADGWRAGRFGTGAPVTEIPIPYDVGERLAWWRAKRERERVRALLAEGHRNRECEERARGFC